MFCSTWFLGLISQTKSESNIPTFKVVEQLLFNLNCQTNSSRTSYMFPLCTFSFLNRWSVFEMFSSTFLQDSLNKLWSIFFCSLNKNLDPRFTQIEVICTQVSNTFFENDKWRKNGISWHFDLKIWFHKVVNWDKLF